MNNLLKNLPENIASLFGLGRISKFPGTLGSIAAFIFSFVCFYFFDKTIYTTIFLLSVCSGFWAITKLQTNNAELEKRDYSWIVIDEWIGMWFVGFILFNHPFSIYSIYVAIFGFIIFRLIDIYKFIPPIRIIDSKEVQTASSIILDDVIAGVYTYAIIMLALGFYNLIDLHDAFLILLIPMIANAAPVLLRRINILSKPINVKFFGENKTWRGFIGGTLVGTLSFPILAYFAQINLTYPENVIKLIVFCFLLSFGALLGDLVKSFFKRRSGVLSGASWAPWDQIDYVLGAIVLTYIFIQYSLANMILYIIIGGAISTLAHRSAYFLRMINTKF